MDQPSRWQAGKNKIKQRKIVSPLNSLEEMAPNNKGSKTSLNGVICAHTPMYCQPWTPWIQGCACTSTDKAEQWAHCSREANDSSHRSYKQDLLRQTQTQAVPLVWVTVFIIDPQNNRTLQAHFSSYQGVKNWSRELSPWINKFSNLPRLFKQFLSAINKFYNGSCKAHSLSPTHTQCKYSLTLVFRTLESIKSPNHRTQST